MITSLAMFGVATVAVVVVGPRLARVVEVISDRTGAGEVLAGAVLLGAVTSLPGLVLTVTAAARGDSELAVANALGGVVAQTAFIAAADIAYRRRTLSSGVPTRQVALQSALLVVLLSLVTIGLGSSEATLGRIHPVTPLVVAGYATGLLLSRRLEAPSTGDADVEGGQAGRRGKIGEPEPSRAAIAEHQLATGGLWARFGVFAAGLAVAGYILAVTGSDIADRTALSATSVGLVLTSVATSTPELVTAVAAARRGAIGLAAGDIIGGNVFDTLFIAAADVVSPESVYATAGTAAVGLAGLAMLLNGLLLAGLMRQGSGTGRIDVESLAIVATWIVALVVVAT